jgi:phage terminase large subunit-like protein
MPTWNFACPDWEDRIRSGRSLLPALPLWEDEANRAVTILNRLRLHDVPGTPTMAEAGGPWFLDMVRAVHGSLNPVTNRRMVPGVFLLVPKKNNKTTGSGLFMLTSLLMNRRPNASFGLFGPTQKTAEDAYDAAAGAIELDAKLKSVLKTTDHLKTIVHRISGAELNIATFDPKIATGKKFAGWLLDEIHILGSMASAAKTLTQMRGARGAITESFGVIITTQSDSPPAGVFRQELDYARRVRAGEIDDPQVLPLLYEFPEEVQKSKDKAWEDPAIWHMVNPNLGRSVDIDTLKALRSEARDKGPAEYRVWASQHLNIEIGLALHNDRWSGADHWEKATDSRVTLEYILEHAEVCTVGIDGGGLDDLLAVTVIGRHRLTGRWMWWGRAWVDRGVLANRKDIAPRLLDLEASGDLVIIDIDTGREAEAHGGEAEGALNRDSRAATSPDVLAVGALVRGIFEAGLLPEKNGVGLDPVGVAAIVHELSFLPEGCMTGVAQGYRLNGAIQGAARKLKDGGLVHGGQPLMAFAVGNAKQEARGNAVVITKETAGSAKIDPLLAGFNAFHLMSLNPEATGGPSVYETRGLLMV